MAEFERSAGFLHSPAGKTQLCGAAAKKPVGLVVVEPEFLQAVTQGAKGNI